jgi:hypothetical protein
MTKLAIFLAHFHLLMIVGLCAADEDRNSPFVAAELSFVSRIEPLFAQKCGGCHGRDAKEIKGEFDMRSRKTLLSGGESGDPAVIPKNAKKSPLLAAIEWRDGMEMPPKKNDRLTAEQIGWVRDWINAGAPWPDSSRREQLKKLIPQNPVSSDGVQVATSGGTTEAWTNRRYKTDDLWSYAPLWRDNDNWLKTSGKNPIDELINIRLRAAKITPLAQADRPTLIRRLTFDLIGLPPTPAEIEAFVNDKQPRAFDRLLDRLLKSPHYGEQWGRHWLDVVRYADSAGFANDFARPNAWRYRDYVIRSFNADLPYDQFLREQIAGDELYDQQLAKGEKPSVDLLIATGFLRMGPWEHTAMSVAAVTRQHFLDDVTNNVGVTFLAHELRCASCHDHKFDPIPTQDYYSMQAVFAPLQFADRTAPYHSGENTAGFEEARTRIERLQKSGGIRSLKTIPKNEWSVTEWDPETERIGHSKVNKKRTAILERELKRFKPYAFSVYSGRERSLKSNTPVWKTPALGNRNGPIPAVYILTGGSLESPAGQVHPNVLSVVKFTAGPIESAKKPNRSVKDSKTATSTLPQSMNGRRIALANWLTNERNPLTARVIANRIWQYHFGRGLAGNPNNFGATGKKPTHPKLLDYLAGYLIANDWSIKSLHRLIVSSDTWQRSSGPIAKEVQDRDADNRLYSFFAPRKLTAEELRDSMLLVSGELSTQQGGMPAHPEINEEVAMQPRHIMGSVAPAYQPDRTPQQRNRRTIYAERIRTLRDPLLEVFNQPGLDTSCEQRDSSTIAPQAFTLLNSEISFNRALAFANRLAKATKKPNEQIQLAFQSAFGRTVTAPEVARCVEHYTKMLELHRKQGQPKQVTRPNYVVRQMVEEMTGLTFFWVEDLDVAKTHVPDLKPWDAPAETRALADICLVLINANEFIYVY